MNQIVTHQLALLQQYQQKTNQDWYVFAETNSVQSTWAFDRFRIGSPSTAIEVAVFEDSELISGDFGANGSNQYGDFPVILNGATNKALDVQPFSQKANFEHSFTFDLSASAGKKYIAIRNMAGICYQVYSYPTGYSATREKNAELTRFYAAALGDVRTWANSIGRIRLDNQVMEEDPFGNWLECHAKEVRLDNTTFAGGEPVNTVLSTLDVSEEVGGTFTFAGLTHSNPQAYDSLDLKAWTLTQNQ
tara:strand:+ start:21530 stop:22270 length:741 start_codon:yes stop_codon:yes gene_type:complete